MMTPQPPAPAGTLRRELALVIALVISATVAVSGGAAYLSGARALKASALDAAREHIRAAALDIESRLAEARADVSFLAGTAPMRGLLRARDHDGRDPVGGSSYDEWRQRFERNAVALLESKRRYLQVRYLDEHGRERIRVERDGERIVALHSPELQLKGAEPYFAEVMGLATRQVYVSPITLNREHGAIETPHRPVLRVGLGLLGPSGKTRGALLINLDARALLDVLGGGEGVSYLVNQDGYFLKHPNPQREYGFDLGRDQRLAHTHPQLAARIDGRDEHIEYDPTPDGEEEEPSIQGFRRIRYNSAYPQRHWLVVYELPARVALAPVAELARQFAAGGLLTVLLGAGLGFLWATRYSRPVLELAAAAQDIAGGDWARRVDAGGQRGELRTLGLAFNRMVDALVTAQNEVRTLNAELEQRVKARTTELSAANQELEAFCYSVSHDLRAPLRAIDGFSQALVEDYGERLDRQATDYLGRVRVATQRMGQLIDDLLMLSRVTRVAMRREPADLTQLAEGVLAELRQADPQRDVAVSLQPGLATEGDPKLLRILLQNLIANAWKFTARQPHSRIELGALAPAGAGERVFFVRDNGAGFDMTYAHKLFGAFQRLHSLEEFPGTGIGLAIARRIVNRHGGRIWAEAAVDKGATFYFAI